LRLATVVYRPFSAQSGLACVCGWRWKSSYGVVKRCADHLGRTRISMTHNDEQTMDQLA
jgi:hypothetical protein